MPAHVCTSLISLVQRYPSRVTTSCDGRRLTGQAVHDRVALLSRALSETLSVRSGDRIAIAGLNSDLLFEALLAITDAGAVACPLNTRWSSTEVAAALQLTQPTYIIADSSADTLIVASCAQLQGPAPRIILLGSLPHVPHFSAQAADSMHPANRRFSTEQLIADAAARLAAQAAPASPAAHRHSYLRASASSATSQPILQLLQSGADGIALVCFTSGTTGRSKGAMLSHSALMHQSMSKLAVVGYSSSDVYLHVAPLFHIGGISSALAVMAAAGAHVFMPRYSPSTVLQLIQSHSVTAMIAVPAMMQDITTSAANSQQQQRQLPSLQRVLIGGGTMSADLQARVAALFPNALLSTACGMTEASSSITFITLHEQQRRQMAAAAKGVTSVGVCVGWPAPGIAISIDPFAADDQQVIQPLSSSEVVGLQQQQQGMSCFASSSSSSNSKLSVGEVCTRGPNVMTGYWDQPDVTKVTITPDGWLRTGDLGYLDHQGCLWLVGRAKDMIKSGGENVHALEVESALMTHPAVAAAAVVGLEHPRLGEQVAAAVVLKPGWLWQQNADQTQRQQVVDALLLQQHCRASGLSPYKVARMIIAVESLPVNSSGKVVKAEVKQLLQQQQQQQLEVSHSSQQTIRSRL